jgi:uncharacterized membrane protein
MQKIYYYGAALSLITLIFLGVAWELVLDPLRPGGSWLVLKVLPLLLPLRGVLKRDLYTMQWAAMLILLYLAEGIVRATTDPGMSAVLGAVEVVLVCVFFFCTILYLRPYKRAAKALTRHAIRKAAE